MSEVHAQARTTQRARAEILASQGKTERALAERYNVKVATVRDWRYRDQVQGLSHRPHRLATT